MNIFKKHVNFNNIIYFTVISFIVYQVSSLYNIDIIYVTTHTLSPILYAISSIVFIASTILFSYYLPILFVFEVYTFYINLQVRIDIKPKVIKKEIIFSITYVESNLFQKLNVIRC